MIYTVVFLELFSHENNNNNLISQHYLRFKNLWQIFLNKSIKNSQKITMAGNIRPILFYFDTIQSDTISIPFQIINIEFYNLFNCSYREK